MKIKEYPLSSACPYNPESELESSLIRRMMPEKAEFTGVIEHFSGKCNDLSELYKRTLNRA